MRLTPVVISEIMDNIAITTTKSNKEILERIKTQSCIQKHYYWRSKQSVQELMENIQLCQQLPVSHLESVSYEH